MFDRHVARQAASRPNAPAVLTPAGPISYRKLNEDVDRAVWELAGLDVPAGQIVSLSLRDQYLHWVIALALARKGMASGQSADVEAEFRVCDAGAADGRPGLIVSTDVAARITGGPIRPATTVDPDPDAVGRVWRTSGTTGDVKRVGATWRRLELYTRDAADHFCADCDGSWIAATGVEIGYGVIVTLGCWAAGSTIVLGYGPNLVDTVIRTRPRLIAVVPFQLVRLLASLPPGLPSWPIRVVSSGGPVPASLARKVAARFGPDLLNVYGASEGGTLTVADLPLLLEREGAAGTPFPGVKIEIRDDEGNPQPAGELGHVFIGGPNVASEYLGDPERSARCFRGGWFETGDMGRFSDDVLTLEGRADDLMNIGGHKILPRWIEDAVLAEPGVTEAHAFSVSDENGLARCFLALAVTEDFDSERLGIALKQQLRFLPTIHVLKLPALPRNAMGKVEREKLREMARNSARR
jgi:oxalate---CoA ligase